MVVFKLQEPFLMLIMSKFSHLLNESLEIIFSTISSGDIIYLIEEAFFNPASIKLKNIGWGFSTVLLYSGWY